QPIEKFWRIMRPTARHGVQVLIDDSEALAPYARDQKELLQEIRRVIGQEKVEVIHFLGTPLRKENGGPTTEDYKTPPVGTPVLLVTDLGIGRTPFSAERASVYEWLKFVGFVNKAGCRVIAFVPYSQNRWPRILTNTMKIISWDRSTTANASRNWKN